MDQNRNFSRISPFKKRSTRLSVSLDPGRSEMDRNVELRGRVLLASTRGEMLAVLAQLHLLSEGDLRAILMDGPPELWAIQPMKTWPATMQAEAGPMYLTIVRRLQLTPAELLHANVKPAVQSLAHAMAGSEQEIAVQLLRGWQDRSHRSAQELDAPADPPQQHAGQNLGVTGGGDSEDLPSRASRHEPAVGTRACHESLLGKGQRKRVVQTCADGQKIRRRLAGTAEVKQEPGYMGPLTRSRRATQQKTPGLGGSQGDAAPGSLALERGSMPLPRQSAAQTKNACTSESAEVQANSNNTSATVACPSRQPAVSRGPAPEAATLTASTRSQNILQQTGLAQMATEQTMPPDRTLSQTSAARPFRRAAHQCSLPAEPLLQAAAPNTDLAASAVSPSTAGVDPSAQTYMSAEAIKARTAQLQLAVLPQHATAHPKATTSDAPVHLPQRLERIPERLLDVIRHSGKEIKFVVDLDHTVIHSALEGEMSDADCSGMAALLDAEKSLLPEQRTLHCLEMAGDKYWLKLRPVAREFLEKLAEVGQIAVFTLGIGWYARLVTRVLDPDARLFGNRIMTRADSDQVAPSDFVKRFWKDLEGQDNVSVVFDDSAHVWRECLDNLIPIPPYCYWHGREGRYWQCEHLNSKANVLRGFDERIEHGALFMAWNAAVSVLSSALLGPPSPSASVAPPRMPQQDVRPHLVSRRQQVLDGEAVYLMGFQEEDLAFFKERITLYGGEIVDAARYSTTVLVHPSKTEEARWHQKAAVRVEW